MERKGIQLESESGNRADRIKLKRLKIEGEFVGADRSSGHWTTSTYRMRLGDAAPDTLIFLSERALYHQATYPVPREVSLEGGHRESRLREKASEGDSTCRVLLALLSGCRSYQFHDTSPQANVRRSRYIEDASYLRDDAGNLAPYLYALRETRPDSYRRIVDTACGLGWESVIGHEQLCSGRGE
ncbi:MAG: hypothetical protein OXU69_13905 [Gemmatimonadota bacterium]|nr:hypothetical protein [Gemmatimonadota bacterium]